MSQVTGITIQTSLLEDHVIFEAAANTWLEARNQTWGLDRLDSLAGGSKFPPYRLFGGGFNYFDGQVREAFIDFVIEYSWVKPDAVILLVADEDGELRIFKPKS